MSRENEYARFGRVVSSGGGMGSIPRGVGAPPPPGTHSNRGKLMCIKVRMLDDTIAVFHLGHKALGQTLMDEVSRHLNLLERDYFGLVFIDCTGMQVWLEMEKPILRQIANTRADAKFYLIVKFYTPNPADLEEEYTRYLFTLQIRRDLATGELACSESTAALLSAYIVQADCGDFSEDDYPDARYLSHTRFVPRQTMELQELVRNNHRRLVGMSPAEADLALLEVARRCEFYGIKLHPCKDIEGAEASLASFHAGIKVFHHMQCVSTFSWAKVRKLSFKRKKLLIKLHPDASQFYKETIEFIFDTRNECKAFWKKCVEQHAFFRCVTADTPRKEGKLFSTGSSFRYRGRTHKELIDYVREHHKRREPFTRPLRSATATATRSNYASSSGAGNYVSGYVSDPGTTARSNHKEASNGALSDSDYARILKKKTVVQGVNSTFANCSMTQSVSSAFARSVSSDSGEETMARSIAAASECSPHHSRHQSDAELTTSTRSPRTTEPKSSRSLNYAVLACSSQSVTQPLPTLPPPLPPPIATVQPTVSSANPVNPVVPPPPPVRSPVATVAPIPMRSILTKSDSFDSTARDETDRISCAIREVLMNERTAERELRLLSSLREALSGSGSCRPIEETLTLIAHIHSLTQTAVEELENSVATGLNLSNIMPIMLRSAHNAIPSYEKLVDNLPVFISAMDQCCQSNPTFAQAVKSYLSLPSLPFPHWWLLTRAITRFSPWPTLLGTIVECLLQGGEGEDAALSSARVCMDKVSRFVDSTARSRLSLYSFVTLLQAEADLALPTVLAHPHRHLIRVGRVERATRIGLVSRLMFLFTDCLLVAARTRSTPADESAPFRVQLLLPLKGMLFEDGDTFRVTDRSPDCITLYHSDTTLVFASHNKDLWLTDIREAVKVHLALQFACAVSNVQAAARSRHDLPTVNIPFTASTTLEDDDSKRDDNSNNEESAEIRLVTKSPAFTDAATSTEQAYGCMRKMSPIEMSWHRSTSIGLNDWNAMTSTFKSGYMLRKLRNSSGWQKLWVVIANFALFFYKNHQDATPLANLPLLEYAVCIPTLQDAIPHEHVFKLCYSTHTYFFRAENQHSMLRWMEVIRQTTLARRPIDSITALALHL